MNAQRAAFQPRVFLLPHHKSVPDIHDTLETKAGFTSDAAVTHGDLMRTFETFKAANDERLNANAFDRCAA